MCTASLSHGKLTSKSAAYLTDILRFAEERSARANADKEFWLSVREQVRKERDHRTNPQLNQET